MASDPYWNAVAPPYSILCQKKALRYVRMTDSLSSCPCISVSEGQLNRPVFVAILKSKVLGIYIFGLKDNHGKTVRTGILNALKETKWGRFWVANDASAPISSRSTKELTSDSEIRFRSESGNGISAANTGSNDPHLMFSPQKTYK